MIPIQEVAEPSVAFPLTELIDLPSQLAFLEYELLGSSLLNWAVASGVFALALPFLRIVLSIVAGRLEAIDRRTSGRFGGLVVGMLRNTKGFVIVVIAAWIAALTLSPAWAAALWTAVQVVLLVQVGLWSADIVNIAMQRYRTRQIEEDPGAATAIGALAFLGRLLLWSVILLMVLSALNFEIGPALAGLGVGGIAVALAVQNILGDLFASLSIIFDRPFVIGDFIIVDDQMGVVEHVGLKTTRVRSLSGEQLIFSNSDLLSSRVRNFKRMDERRILFHFGVQYDTGHEKLKEIPGVVRGIIEAVENVRFDRAHFADFGDSSLDFEVVYYMTVPDFGAYRDAQQAINLELYRRMEEMGVSFAFPTRTLHLHMENGHEEGPDSAGPLDAPHREAAGDRAEAGRS